MHYKREPCRNYQRGSCQYGERCKFLHVFPQQQKSNLFGTQNKLGIQQNADSFGFGSHSGSHQQQKPNPFGFGIQNGSKSKGPPDFDFKQHQFKPFENKWTRGSSLPQNAGSHQSDNLSQHVNHQCTDPETCRGQIAEDFEHEKPLWKLTCYSHCKSSPCDIVGDISYEELRAAAYDNAKHGISLQSIVERERNLLNSKLAEFENLLREPYKMPLNSPYVSQNQSPGANAIPFQTTAQNHSPLSVSSFSQLGSSLNLGFERGPSAPLKYTLSQTSSSETEGGHSLTSFNTSSLKSRGNSTTQQSFISGNASSFNTMFPASTDAQLLNKSQARNASGDDNIWFKEKWSPGEIPEEAPPYTFARD